MAGGNDMNAHNSTFEGFIGLVKWGVIATTVVTVFVIYMITK
ncbi:MAG: aa3-type cytochrome c oxidase subunit IV [Sphingomonadales bacterium]|nr:aa3-type cytochrome c oxidase subunit IV [Sphingomonadales bacterium]